MSATLTQRRLDSDHASVADATRARPLGVAMLIHRFYPHVGGAETQLQALIPHLQARGIDVRVITRQEPGAPGREWIHGARVFRTDIPRYRVAASLMYSLRSLRYLAQARRSIDVIHAHGLLSPTTTAVLAKLTLRRPVVVTAHGFQADLALLGQSFLGAERLHAFAVLVDRFVVISREIGDGLEHAGVPPSKLRAIPNGIDVDVCRPPTRGEKDAARTQLGLGAGPTALFVGRLEPVKGASHLLRAWQSVQQHIPEAELLVVGDGSERPTLEARQVPGVRFVGTQVDPLPYYRAADCFVLPSHSEGLPVALLEALAMRLAVVSTAVGGATEILDGYEASCLVPPGDVEALATALDRALAGPADAGMLDALRRRIASDYSIERTARLLASTYFELAGREPGR